MCEDTGCGTGASTASTNAEGATLPSWEFECRTTINQEWGVKEQKTRENSSRAISVKIHSQAEV